MLIGLAGLVWFERVLPGASGFAEQFGSDAVLRFVIGVLCLYVVLLVLERQRMENAFKEVLGAFREFHAKASGGAASGPPGANAAQQEAVRLLIGALRSPDAQVRASSAAHLKRLTGQDLGEDGEAWNRWLAQQAP
ncbi:MAG: hypothetical protein AAF628_32335 [Planctomycetota bacterium]